MKPLVEVLTSTTAWFKERGIPSARLDAELLLGHVLGLDRVRVYLAFDRPLKDEELERLRPLVRRRGNREPLAWILGHKEFYGRDFVVTPGVLVPRPDTETLIEAVLAWIPASSASGGGGGAPRNAPPAAKKSLPWNDSVAAEATAATPALSPEPDTAATAAASAEQAEPPRAGGVAGGGSPLPQETPDQPVYVADIGSGTGCIGLTLALERPALRLYAVDRADEPLAATRANVAALGLDKRVAVLRGDLLAAIPTNRPIDWVVSNPPYIPADDLAGLEPEVRDHEPRGALDGGADGLDVYRRLVPVAAARARQGVIVEVGAGQAQAVAALMTAAGLSDVRIWKDLSGTERVVGGRK